MVASRLTLFFSIFVLAALWLPAPVSAFDESIMPDGCLGNLNENQVIVYYFHRKFGCQHCQTLESTLQKTLQVAYNDFFRTGRLAMCVVNVDDPENRHYLDQFGILSNTIIIAQKENGNVSRFEAVEEIWDAAEDKDAISRLLCNAVDNFLRGS